MQYLVTAEEMRRYDNNTIEKIGIPAFALMERAALKACERVLCYLDMADIYLQESKGVLHSSHISFRDNNTCHETAEKYPTILIMAGYGNNGGDGLALARLLSEYGFEVSVWCVGDGDKASSLWRKQSEILEHYPVQVWHQGDAKSLRSGYNVCVDALFGVGLSREITGDYAEAIQTFNQIKGWKLALDVPSGIDADTGNVLGTCVKADATITFGFCKRGLVLYPGCEYAGCVEVADIGISDKSFFGQLPKMFTLKEKVQHYLPRRRSNGNKGTFGKVLLVAGSVNMAGAAVLAAKAAYRTGAGMVKVISPKENRVILQKTIPEALYGTEEDLINSIAWADVIGIGPGLGTDERARKLLDIVLNGSDKPLVLDADALNLLAEDGKEHEPKHVATGVEDCSEAKENLAGILAKQGAQGRTIIVTPHVGELARLTGRTVSDCLADGSYKIGEIAYETAMKLHSIVVAKDARTFVCREGNAIYLNSNGNSGMATAGSGDVLTGIISALLGQGMDGFWAAVTGVYMHGAAGDAAADKNGEHACMAGDIAEAIAEVCKQAPN